MGRGQNRTGGRFYGILIKNSLDGRQTLRFWKKNDRPATHHHYRSNRYSQPEASRHKSVHGFKVRTFNSFAFLDCRLVPSPYSH